MSTLQMLPTLPVCDVREEANVKTTVPMEVIEGKILLIRGQKVMLDRDLAQSTVWKQGC